MYVPFGWSKLGKLENGMQITQDLKCVDELLVFPWVLTRLAIRSTLLGSMTTSTSAFGGAEVLDVLLPSLVSNRSIIRVTVAIPALTSLLTPEPISAMELLCESSRSLHPRVFLAIDSLYLFCFWRRSIINVCILEIEDINNLQVPHRNNIPARFQIFWKGLQLGGPWSFLINRRRMPDRCPTRRVVSRTI